MIILKAIGNKCRTKSYLKINFVEECKNVLDGNIFMPQIPFEQPSSGQMAKYCQSNLISSIHFNKLFLCI